MLLDSCDRKNNESMTWFPVLLPRGAPGDPVTGVQCIMRKILIRHLIPSLECTPFSL